MRKIWVIARREYMAMVGSKAFLISVAIMPILMLGGAIAPNLLKDQVDLNDKQIALVDQSEQLVQPLQQAVAAYNEQGVNDPESGKQVRPKYRLKIIRERPVTDELRLKLSDQVRNGELYAFIEIPADVLKSPGDGEPTVVDFFAENAVLSEGKNWFAANITTLVQTRRLRSAGIDPTVVAASRAITVKGRGLFNRDASGQIKKAGRSAAIMTILMPLGIMMFMFMLIMMSAQPMLESVLEEKTNRIAEVLLGSATPSQIMGGKLFGNVGGSLTIATIYVTGGYLIARYNNMADAVHFEMLPWFLAFQILAVLMFSSIFLAIGASVNQLKEAQSLLMPVWIVVVLPMFVWLNIVREPNGSFATWFSLVPPFIPMLMCLRLAVSTAVPAWQPVAGVAIMVVVTALCVFLAGRIFRIGMLVQGRAPKLTELIRWAVAG